MTKSQEAKPMRVATYNVHKCRGLDGRVRPERIVRVLSEIDADIVALQEVVCMEGKTREDHQAQYIAEELGFHAKLGENRRYKGGDYGNVLLSRFPIHHAQNYDISINGRERRGCLRADVRLKDGGWLHIFNLHLGTSFFERRHQARTLFRQQILTDGRLPGRKIVLGDFNEWTKGLASRMLGHHFTRAKVPARLGRAHTYPGFFPVLPLDHIYFDHELKLNDVTLHRSRTALVASDHVPLVAEFGIPVAAEQSLRCEPPPSPAAALSITKLSPTTVSDSVAAD
jgi:endonuclease/exonuclease/phosphatase family metal-dependent hydrolase